MGGWEGDRGGGWGGHRGDGACFCVAWGCGETRRDGTRRRLPARRGVRLRGWRGGALPGTVGAAGGGRPRAGARWGGGAPRGGHNRRWRGAHPPAPPWHHSLCSEHDPPPLSAAAAAAATAVTAGAGRSPPLPSPLWWSRRHSGATLRLPPPPAAGTAVASVTRRTSLSRVGQANGHLGRLRGEENRLHASPARGLCVLCRFGGQACRATAARARRARPAVPHAPLRVAGAAWEGAKRPRRRGPEDNDKGHSRST